MLRAKSAGRSNADLNMKPAAAACRTCSCATIVPISYAAW
jgi:hypothetical protein